MRRESGMEEDEDGKVGGGKGRKGQQSSEGEIQKQNKGREVEITMHVGISETGGRGEE